jgi:hypothetical protein
MKKLRPQVQRQLLKKAKKGDNSWRTPRNHFFNRLIKSIQGGDKSGIGYGGAFTVEYLPDSHLVADSKYWE